MSIINFQKFFFVIFSFLSFCTSLTLSVQISGLTLPTSFAIDRYGHVWISEKVGRIDINILFVRFYYVYLKDRNEFTL